MDGMELLSQIQEHHSGTNVIMATAFGTIDVAVEANETWGMGFHHQTHQKSIPTTNAAKDN